MATDKRLPQVKTVVLVKDLVKAIERVRDAEISDAIKSTAAYQVAHSAWRRDVKARLRAKLADIDGFLATSPSRKYGRNSIEDYLTDDLPEAPSAPNDIKCIRGKYDTLIAQLNLSPEPKVRLGAEDFRKFMTGDASACVC